MIPQIEENIKGFMKKTEKYFSGTYRRVLCIMARKAAESIKSRLFCARRQLSGVIISAGECLPAADRRFRIWQTAASPIDADDTGGRSGVRQTYRSGQLCWRLASLSKQTHFGFRQTCLSGQFCWLLANVSKCTATEDAPAFDKPY